MDLYCTAEEAKDSVNWREFEIFVSLVHTGD
jgi:hypothetical protein